MMTKIEKLLKSTLNVFTVQDLATIWQMDDKKKLWNNIRYYLRVGKLIRVHRGVYVKGEYTSFEVAQKLVTPSYISFYTALARHGVIFQLYTSIHCMALISKNLSTERGKFIYHKLKEKVFFDSSGIEDMGNYHMAGPERAICDSLYLVPGLGFDSLEKIDFSFLRKISKIYHNQRLEAEVKKIITLETK